MSFLKRNVGAILGLAVAASCSSSDLYAISEGIVQGLAEASYDMSYQGSGPYYGVPYTPNGFSSFSGWPNSYSYGQYIGAYRCSQTGTFYTCDSNGDGFADMYGDTADGSYASSTLRVNGRGQAFTWDTTCSCWMRNPAFDGPRPQYYKNYNDY